MANQTYFPIRVELLGDGVSTTATLALNSTPIYVDVNVKNFSDTPDSVSLVQIRDELGNPVPATATLSKNGKQVIITFSAAFTGKIVAVINLGFNV